MTDAQGQTVARLMRDFNVQEANITVGAFDLPEGWVQVTLPGATLDGALVAGIDPNGQASM